MIRVEEQRIKGKTVIRPKRLTLREYYEYLSREGKIHEAEEWFFHEGIQALFNGSLSKSDVPPTKIPLDRIKELVKIGLDQNLFYENCSPRKCRNCTKAE